MHSNFAEGGHEQQQGAFIGVLQIGKFFGGESERQYPGAVFHANLSALSALPRDILRRSMPGGSGGGHVHPSSFLERP